MNLIQTIHIRAKGRKVRRALQAGKIPEHEAIAAQARKGLMKTYGMVEKGKINAEEFEKRFQQRLVKAYEEAFRIGKGEDILSDKDRRWINSYAAEQFEYVHGFANDIDDGNIRMAAEDRVGLYAKSTQAAYWKGATADFDGPIDWILGPNENNCEDCVELADNSPYEPEDLPTMPGQGFTVCGNNCKCFLVEAN